MKKIIILTILICIVTLAKAQDVFPFGVIEKIESKALNETRVLNIYLPDGYHPDSVTTYNTIYVLDGSANEDFPHIAGLCQFMNMYGLLPKSIVVGIANVDRYRDFTYLSVDPQDLKDIPTSGGSEKFIAFIENELQPLITKNYKTNGNKTIIGQSLGGLLATEILMKKPELFDNYVIVSPSLWWDKQNMINSASDYFKANNSLSKKVFIGVGGKEHPVMVKTAKMLNNAIKQSKNDEIELFFTKFKAENHETILHRAVYLAFEQFYGEQK